MAMIDSARGLLVIRIVYDGPAFSGKTTSLKALAEGVSVPLESPEEHDGRTLYFDWMEYVGGLFEGRQIRCQIVSVPGQSELAARRRRLLESADAVVCVLDTRAPELDFGLAWLSEVVALCRADDPPVGVVLQANKRDADDAVPRGALREHIDRVAPVAIVETVATSSDGIREAFVLAVRLALDRVRALSLKGQLGVGEPSEQNAANLLRNLREAELGTDDLAPRASTVVSEYPLPSSLDLSQRGDPPPTERPHSPGPIATEECERVFVPDPLMPGGMIWPPVDGRTLLHEVAGLDVRPTRTPRGDWWGSGAGWRFHSSTRALYSDANLARHGLIDWARFHAASAGKISGGRVVILADAGGGLFRLWQLVRVEPVLRERLEHALTIADPPQVAEELLDVAAQLISAREWFMTGKFSLPCTLWTVGTVRSHRPCFVGLMPELTAESQPELEGEALLARELSPHLRQLRRSRVDYGTVFRELMARAELSLSDGVAHMLTRVARAVS